jgi:NAD(P)-dependent dehydrogenase (short-subunit alcohol dehydrogenase family)
MDLMLEGKIAVVTGAGNGIGRGIALQLAQEGAVVVAADLNAQAAGEVAAEIEENNGRALAVELDATDEALVARMIEKSIAAFDRIDILVNNVGGGSGRPDPVVKLSAADWDRTIDINLRTAFLCSRAAAREMIKNRQGRIISISSISGKMGESLIGPYCAGKFGVIGLMQVLAKELARYGITVNSVCPGYVWTPGWEALAQAMRENFAVMTDKAPEQIFQERVDTMVPLGHPQTAEDIAALVAFLASDRARNITGQAINVDGGAVMH